MIPKKLMAAIDGAIESWESVARGEPYDDCPLCEYAFAAQERYGAPLCCYCPIGWDGH